MALRYAKKLAHPMKVVIQQPYFLPWLGFFSKIAFADGYVALDDVLFRKRHFHDRVRIVSMTGQVKWIGVPVGERLGKALNEIELCDDSFVLKILRTIEYSYARAPFFEVEWPRIKDWLVTIRTGMTLAELNLRLIHQLMTILLPNRKVPIWLSSELACGGSATDRLIAICHKIGASGIIVGAGSSLAPGVHDLPKLIAAGLTIHVQDFHTAGIVYRQVRRQHLSFASGVSVIDAVLNIGSTQTSHLIALEALQPQQIGELSNE